MGRKQFKVHFKKPKGIGLEVYEYPIKQLYKASKVDPKQPYKLAVIPDVHFPNYDRKAVAAALEWLKDYKPHGILFLGDFWEMGEVSRWDRNHNDMDKALKELDDGFTFMKRFLKAAGPQCKTKIFLCGNHEDWMSQYLEDAEKSQQGFVGALRRRRGIDLSFEKLCRLGKLGFDIYPYISEDQLCTMVKIGHAHYTHGYKTGANSAKQLFMEVLACAYQGHTEGLDTYRHASIRGPKEACTLGTLRDRSYAKFTRGRLLKWAHSVSAFEFNYKGEFTRHTMHIIDGWVNWGGKKYGR